MSVQFIKAPNGDELAVLPREEYERLVQIAEEADEHAADVSAYDAAKADLEGSAVLPHSVSQDILKGSSTLRALRRWRGLSQIELAERCGTSQGFISDLESSRRSASAQLRARLAQALSVPPAWLP